MALSDAIKSALSSFSGSLDDRLNAFFVDRLGQDYGSLPDNEKAWLVSETGLSDTYTIPDLWKNYLDTNGYSGTLADMLNALWEAGGPPASGSGGDPMGLLLVITYPS